MYKNQYFASVLVYVLSLSRNDPPNPKIPISNNYLIYKINMEEQKYYFLSFSECDLNRLTS